MKMDRKLISSSKSDKKEFEIKYISKTYNIPIDKVREAVKKVGVSRVKVYDELRLMGYIIIIS